MVETLCSQSRGYRLDPTCDLAGPKPKLKKKNSGLSVLEIWRDTSGERKKRLKISALEEK